MTEEIQKYEDNKKEIRKQEAERKTRQLAAAQIYRDLTRNAATQTNDVEVHTSQSNGHENQATQAGTFILEEEIAKKTENANKDAQTGHIQMRMTENPEDRSHGENRFHTDEDDITETEVEKQPAEKAHSHQNRSNTTEEHIDNILVDNNTANSKNQILLNFYGEQS